MSIRWEGDMVEQLERVMARSRDLSDDAVEGASVILARSDELVPKAPKRPSDDEPTLASTGYIEPHAPDSAAIGYGSVYAHWIHEHMWFQHPHGGQAKFLESAMLEKGQDAINKAGEHFFGRL